MSNSKNMLSSQKDPQPPTCSCVKDPYAGMPPELRPKNKTWKTGFRQVTCPNCKLEFWTNAKEDLCIDCQKKGIHGS